MLALDPRLPLPMLVVYYCVSFLALLLCIISLIAVSRTKKIPQSSKMLSMGLLAFNCIFLVLAGIAKLFNYNDLLILWHITRGLQIAAQIIVASMALERLFVLNWPYVYLRIATDRLITNVCFGVFAFSILQYFIIRGLVCYTRNKVSKCGVAISSYYLLLTVSVPILSLVSYGKIYRMIRSKDGHKKGHSVRQYKGTMASFLILINSTVTQVLCLILSMLSTFRRAKEVQADGYTATLADCVNVINCIVDPLIYVVWFKETRMQALEIIGVICHCVRPTAQKLRLEIFHIATADLNYKRQKEQDSYMYNR